MDTGRQQRLHLHIASCFNKQNDEAQKKCCVEFCSNFTFVSKLLSNITPWHNIYAFHSHLIPDYHQHCIGDLGVKVPILHLPTFLFSHFP